MIAEEKSEIFGQKPGLFLLFFTEMWERFSYYGMRALLVLFLVSQIADGGLGWSRQEALALYGMYTFLVYLTPILGGILADKLLGYRYAVTLGALLMTIGHALMAFETTSAFYAGLGFLIAGNGFFKPNISSIVGQLYADEPEKKDGAYTIFYMGINAGAFLGILLCGYLGEKVGWPYGFGLAGIFMGLGMLMFHFGGPLLGNVGLPPTAEARARQAAIVDDTPSNVVRDRLIVIGILSFFTIFFWMAFEQAGGSMAIFAKDYTGRVLSGGAATAFFWINAAFTIGPLAIVTYVLIRLVQSTFKTIPLSNMFIAGSFAVIWMISIWTLVKEYNMKAFDVAIDVPVTASENPDGTEQTAADPIAQAVAPLATPDADVAASTTDATEDSAVPSAETAAAQVASGFKTLNRTLASDLPLQAGQTIYVVDREAKGGEGKLRVIQESETAKYKEYYKATVQNAQNAQTEVPASWFQILNSFFIITLAPLFNRIWSSKYNPSAPVKFGLGLMLLGFGFGVLALGCVGIDNSAKTASVSMWWLIIAFFFHTLGELCISPVGLSYVSKLAPLKFVGLMFGIWFVASAIANYLAAATGQYIDPIQKEYGLMYFFLLFTIIPVGSGLIMWALTPLLKRMMHGIH